MLYGCQPEEPTQQSKAPSVQQTITDNTATANVSKEAFTKLAKDTGCFACHSIDKKLLGPAWKNVAALYRYDPAGEDKLMNKIAKGGGGAWGNIEMPAYPTLGEAKTRILVRYILSLE